MSKKGRYKKKELIRRIRKLVRQSNYVLSRHATEGIKLGKFSLGDIACCIANGEITKIEEDEIGNSKDGKKYTIIGFGKAGAGFGTVGKFIDWIYGETFYVITAYGRR